MHSTRRRLTMPMLTVAAVTLLAACGPTPGGGTDGGTDAGTDGGNNGACTLGQAGCCVSNRDCSDLATQYTGYTPYCEKSTGACQLLCNTASDCSKKEFSPDTCSGGACVCDEGICEIPACSSTADCNGTGQCIGGKCTTGQTADGCVIAPTPIYTHDGEKVVLHAYATKGGQYVVPDSNFTWSSSSPVASVAPDTSESSMATITGGVAPGSATITATIGTATCTVTDTNYAAATSGNVRVVVLDALTRSPVPGARVVVKSGAGETDDVTDNTGVVDIASPGGTSFDVSVFTAVDPTNTDAPNGYQYVTVMGTTSNDLVIYLPRNKVPDMSGGYKGTLTTDDFAKLGADSVHLALAGTSIPGNFMDLDLSVLIGELIQTHISLAGVDQNVPLPSGMVLGIGSNMFKGDYDPLGIPGLRTAWALGGNLPLDKVTQVLGPVISGGSTSNLPIGQLVGQLLPLFNGLYSSVTPGVSISEYARVQDPNDNTKTLPDFSKFPDQALNFDTALGLKAIVDVPTLPKLADGSYLDGAVILGGTRVVGQGLVPLGVTAGTDVSDPQNDTPNGVVNDTGANPDPGKVIMRLAPEHGGIEGSDYVILSIALSFGNLTGGGGTAISGLSKEVSSIGYQQEINFGPTAYMPFANGAKLDSATRVFTPAAVDGADFYRLALTNGQNQGWVVYHASAASPITLPDPTAYLCGGASAPCGDRLEAGETADAQAVMTTDGTTLDQLATFNSENLDSLGTLVKGFSNLGITAQ